MPPDTTVAILIKHPELFDPACRCARALVAGGATVAVFCLCGDDPDDGFKTQLEHLNNLPSAAASYLDDPRLAARHGLSCISTGELAQRLKSIDRVLPF